MSLQTTGRLNLRQIEKQPLEIELDPNQQKWLRRAFANAAPSSDLVGMDAEAWAQAVEFEGQMRLESLKPDYMVRGDFEAKVPSACSRCLEPFMAERSGHFEIFLKRLEKGDSTEESDDPDYWMIDSDEFDLAPIITEQLVVLEPIAESQHRDADGELSCHIEEGAEFLSSDGEGAEIAKSPFAVLASLKLKSPSTGDKGSKN